MECLKTFVQSVFFLYDLFSTEKGKLLSVLLLLIALKYDFDLNIFIEKKLETFEEKINDNSFTFETLKDDGFMLSKIPNYLKSN